MISIMKLKHQKDIKKQRVQAYGSTKTTIQWLWNKENDKMPNFAMRRFEIEKGGNIGMHEHPWEHEIYVLSGKGKVFTPEEEIIAQADDALYMPPNIPHGYSNEYKEPFIFLCMIPNTEK